MTDGDPGATARTESSRRARRLFRYSAGDAPDRPLPQPGKSFYCRIRSSILPRHCVLWG